MVLLCIGASHGRSIGVSNCCAWLGVWRDHIRGIIGMTTVGTVSSLRHAACVIVLNEDYDILSVSRRGQPSAYGLPGGKVENGEHSIDAAIRETAEETGLHLVRTDLVNVYRGDDGHGYDVVAYAYRRLVNSAHIKQMEPDMAVSWVTPSQLLSGPFVSYNDAVLKAMLFLSTGALF